MKPSKWQLVNDLWLILQEARHVKNTCLYSETERKEILSEIQGLLKSYEFDTRYTLIGPARDHHHDCDVHGCLNKEKP